MSSQTGPQNCPDCNPCERKELKRKRDIATINKWRVENEQFEEMNSVHLAIEKPVLFLKKMGQVKN